VLAALIDGRQALKRLFPDEEAVLWPEHFDVAVTVDEVNYGISPGDAEHPLPYAYVGPWTPRAGAFWNEPFGASAPVDGDVERFLSESRRLLTGSGAGAAD
jgi:hypothetical protein